tara:strand:- start:718 stop:912 length:195 start_codon:yes stop_codon:yes gene_type:complete
MLFFMVSSDRVETEEGVSTFNSRLLIGLGTLDGRITESAAHATTKTGTGIFSNTSWRGNISRWL